MATLRKPRACKFKISSTALGSSGLITFSSGRIRYTDQNTTDYSNRIVMTGDPSIYIDTGGQVVTFATALTHGAGRLDKSGAGTLILSKNSTYTGQTTVAAGGTLQFGTGGPEGAWSSSTINLAGTLIFNRSGSYSVSSDVRDSQSAGGTLIIKQQSSTDTITYNGGVSGLGGASNLVQDGPGTLILNQSTNTTWTGSTTINAGTLQIGNNSTNGKLPSGAVTNNGTLRFWRSDALSFSNVVSGTGNVIKNGSASVTLTGANTYTGATTLTAGNLVLGHASALGNTSSINFAGGTLQYSASNTVDYSAIFSTAANQAYKIDTGSQNVTLASALTSVGGSAWLAVRVKRLAARCSRGSRVPRQGRRVGGG